MQFSKKWYKNTKKVQILKFGRLPVGQFSLDFKKKLDLGYFYLYVQYILGATRFGISVSPLGGAVVLFLISNYEDDAN